MSKIMKDGKPSTSFSRQDREWVKSMRGGDTPSGTITITENGEYDVSAYATADVNVAGGSSDFTEKAITLEVTNTDEAHYTYFTYGIYEGVNGLTGEVTALVESNDKWCLADTVYRSDAQVTAGTHTINLLMTADGELQFSPHSGKVLSVSGDIELVQEPGEDGYYIVTGNCTINVDMKPD